jgi:hypothetical protein
VIRLVEKRLPTQKPAIASALKRQELVARIDDKEAVRQALLEAGVEVVVGPFLDFRDEGMQS